MRRAATATALPVADQGLRVQPRTGYRPQIDGLRALAVVGVLMSHFWFARAQTGHLGVRLFFVISGFLITERLLVARTAVDRGQAGRRGELLWFFVRRALRILPAYYALLLVLLIVDADGIRASAAWHVFQLSNIWFALNQAWTPWPIAHFWSLSIEEQFYLVWPWVILLVPMRHLRTAIWLTILIGIAFRFVVLATPLADDAVAIWVLAPASMDALGFGALLAVTVRSGSVPRWVEQGALSAALVWLAIIYSLQVGWLANRLVFSYALQDAISALVFTGLVARAHRNPSDGFGRALAFRPVVALGRISYGVYLYHLPVLAGVLTFIPQLDYGPQRFAICAPVTIMIAALSWIAMERPLVGMKRHLADETAVAHGSGER